MLISLQKLKSYLVNRYPQQLFPYTAEYGGVNTATGRELVTWFF